MEIKIENKIVGDGHQCFIIAEAGVNHNGSLELAKKLVDVAVEAGADAVKFQTFKSEHLVTSYAKLAEYQRKNLGKEQSQLEMLKKLELNINEFKILKEYCDGREIIFLSTPHTYDAVLLLNDLVPAFKIGSGDLNNLPLLEHVAKIGKPILIGTGMSTLSEVKESLDIIKKKANNQVIMLHCTTSYPCPIEDVNLSAMVTMKKELGCLVGYSDHTLGIEVSAMAVYLGAVAIEKHFTLDNNMVGPDHKASLEPSELKQMVALIRNNSAKPSKEVMGDNEKKPTQKEIEIRKIARKSVVAAREIRKGKIICDADLIIKRPGTGLEPKMASLFIGRIAKMDIKKDALMELVMV
jgi:N-acetylneuraminate synthase